MNVAPPMRGPKTFSLALPLRFEKGKLLTLTVEGNKLLSPYVTFGGYSGRSFLVDLERVCKRV